MSIQDDREAIRKLALKGGEVLADTTRTPADRMAESDKIKAEIKAHSDAIALAEQAAKYAGIADVTEPGPVARRGPYRSMAEEFVNLPDVKALKEISGRSTFTVGATLGLKAATDVAEGTAVSGGFLNGIGGQAILPDYLPGVVPILYAPLAISRLFSQASTDSPMVSYVKQSAETIAAAGTAEAAAAPQADATLTRVVEQVGEVTVMEKITDEFVKDAPGLQSWLQTRLTGQVERYEDQAVLNGSGYPSVAGVQTRSGLQVAITEGTTGTPNTPATASQVIEGIFQQITAIRFNAFLEPDAIVMNPQDWQTVRLGKDSNGQYFGGGPFTGAYGNPGPTNVENLWGYRVVISPRQTYGTALVGDFSSATLFRRQGVTVEMTNSDGTDFQNRVVTVRVTSRLALMVPYPGGFGTVTIVH